MLKNNTSKILIYLYILKLLRKINLKVQWRQDFHPLMSTHTCPILFYTPPPKNKKIVI